MDPITEIKRLYYATTQATIQQDLARAIELLKLLPSEEDRERAAVYMDGLSQMRSEWNVYFSVRTTFFRAAIRSGSGTFRSIERPRRSRSFRRCTKVSDIASGVFGFFVSPSMML